MNIQDLPNDRLIYLASPYSHVDPLVMEQRFLGAVDAAAALTNLGLVIFSPIAHSHTMAVNHELPRPWEFWERVDRVFLSRCDVMLILTLEGWQNSIGVNAEIKIAEELGIPLYCLDKEDDGYKIVRYATALELI